MHKGQPDLLAVSVPIPSMWTVRWERCSGRPLCVFNDDMYHYPTRNRGTWLSDVMQEKQESE